MISHKQELIESFQIPDYLSLDKVAGSVESILVVGGGFLGSELAVGMASRGVFNSTLVSLC